KIRSQRVRMEGWRQRRPGSNETKPLISKRKNRLDTNRPSHGRTYPDLGGRCLYSQSIERRESNQSTALQARYGCEMDSMMSFGSSVRTLRSLVVALNLTLT